MEDLELFKDELCDNCHNQKECEARGETSDSWAYEQQFLLCHELGYSYYKTTETLIIE